MASGGRSSIIITFVVAYVVLVCYVVGSEGFVGITQTPISINDSLFVHVRSEIPEIKTPSPFWGIVKRPYPTNSWFSTLSYSSSPIVVFPYLVMPLSELSGVAICYPELVAQNTSYTSSWVKDVIFWINGMGNHSIQSYTLLGVVVQWPPLPGSTSGPTLQVPFVPGSPFITLIFNSDQFNFTSDYQIALLNGVAPSGCVSSEKFRITLNIVTSKTQLWLLYSLTGSIKLCYVQDGYTDNTGSHPIFMGSTGNSGQTILRVVILTDQPTANEATFDKYVPNIVVGGDVSVPEQIGPNNTTVIKFTWHAIDSNGNPNPTDDILMMGLPHHDDCIDKTLLKANGLLPNAFSTIKGTLIGYAGSQWSLKESLTTLDWHSRYPVDSTKSALINSVLASEAANFPPQENDTYGYGKYVASLARLILIAEQQSQDSLIPDLVKQLKLRLGPWLYRVTYRATFLYDQTYGGAISADGWLNSNRDYGNGVYNDHHFHYGYYIYAGAVVLKYDSTWEWGPFLVDLIRDIANPSAQDTYFPITRHKDWYAGHSWAQGLSDSMDGKDQESTAEAVNAYYAIALFGITTKNPLIENIGKILLATEIRSSLKYWHMPPNTTVYPSIFSQNTIVGILWSDKADYRTFFGDNVEYIHCIQMLPFTPITEDLLPSDWVQYEYPVLSPALSSATPEWKAYIIEDLAIIQKEDAWTNALLLPLTAFYKGNSKTNMLWWIATRPTPKATQY